MLVSFVSLRGSPGVSAVSLALGWVWPRDAVIAECDPAGGHALQVFDPDGVHGRRGIVELLLAARGMPLHHAMSGQLLTLPDGTGTHHLLPGAGSPLEAESVHWQGLAGLFQRLETVDVLADCGRLRGRGTPYPVLESADLTVLVVGNDQFSLRTAVASLGMVRDEIAATGAGDDGLVALIVSRDPATDRGFRLPEITREFADRGVPVVGALPWDPATAAQLTRAFRPRRRFASAPLLARSRHVADEIGRRGDERAQRLRRAAAQTQGGSSR